MRANQLLVKKIHVKYMGAENCREYKKNMKRTTAKKNKNEEREVNL